MQARMCRSGRHVLAAPGLCRECRRLAWYRKWLSAAIRREQDRLYWATALEAYWQQVWLMLATANIGELV